MSSSHEAVKEETADDVATPIIPCNDISSVIAAAIAAADKRAEERMQRFTGQMASQWAIMQEENATLQQHIGRDRAMMHDTLRKIGEDNAALKESMQSLKEENALLRRHVEKLAEEETSREGATKRARTETKILQDRCLDEVRAVAEGLERVRTITSLPQNPTRPDMTVATPCGPSTFAISYPNGGQQAVIVRRESFSSLGKQPRPVFFPNARIPVGTRCMIEFELWTSSDAEDCEVSLQIGFTPVSTKGLSDMNHALCNESGCFWLNLNGDCLSKGTVKLSSLPKLDGWKRYALLMDRTNARHTTLRVYVGDHSVKAGMRARGNEIVVWPADVDYIPVANPFGECELKICNILYGNQIEFGWKATP